MLNIELINGGIRVNKIIDKKYTWVIKRDDEIILQRLANSNDNELIFERDLTKKEFYDIPGKYEIYLKKYDTYLGYVKVSNSVFWNK